MIDLKSKKFVFFGTGTLAEHALQTMLEEGFIPELVVTKPDSKIGREQKLSSPAILHLAKINGVKTYQPESLKNLPPDSPLLSHEYDLFIVASYGKIIPDTVLDIPSLGTLNIHPSLLPKHRGPTPIESALLQNEKTLGISIIFLDEQVDHGPVLIQREYADFETFPDGTTDFFEGRAGVRGAELLIEVLPDYISGSIQVAEQNHSEATFTKKFTKETGLVDVSWPMQKILNVYRACTPWPGCFFIHKHKDKDLRVKITKMSILGTDIIIDSVVPEGKREMSYESFKNGYLK
jgi:methionyl-tRNA formyltransferase